jgi:Asp-tRNA(Asn)/Glu-tRNA(Gln) amidotransferase A subunit family amidase
VAIKAHERTNCLTEIILPEAEAWAESEINLNGPLAGIPVSLKDSVVVAGFDASVGYSSKTGKPWAKDGNMVRLLKDAGQHAACRSASLKANGPKVPCRT